MTSVGVAHDPVHSKTTIVEAYTQSIHTIVDGKPEIVRKLKLQRFGAHVENGDGTVGDEHELYHAIYKAVPNAAGAFDWIVIEDADPKLHVPLPKCEVFSSNTHEYQYTDKIRTWTLNSGVTFDGVYVSGGGGPDVTLEPAVGPRMTFGSAQFVPGDKILADTIYVPWVTIREELGAPPVEVDPAAWRFKFADGFTTSVVEYQGWVRHDFIPDPPPAQGGSGKFNEIPHSMVMVADFETPYDVPNPWYLLKFEIYNRVTGAWKNVEDVANYPRIVLQGGQKGIRPRAYNFQYDYRLGQNPSSQDPFARGANAIQFRTSIWDRMDGNDDVGLNLIQASPNPDGISVPLDSHGAHFNSTAFKYAYPPMGGGPPPMGGGPP